MVTSQDIRQILASNEALAPIADQISDDESLFDRGLDSFGSVQLMLALEERFGIEFPDEFLSRKSFATIGAIRETVAAVIRPQAA
ncbi:acyl carrier protein [Methylobacterium sp. Leaf104]|uniref:acyl carrier protein n=1 Tax=Methylobacterium TaxID=407 RepID=UPI0006F28ABD|nr:MULTISPECIES: acyl carrier protein [Methylobacterium]KQP40918.1 acyl carrier protein [Methylobacterium sp. Leaf104]MCI9880872.1 acyl carrier protein [Methylobacterium goesingense]